MGERHREGGLLRLGILASHAGTTMQAVVDACAQGRLHAEVRVAIGNNSRSGALARARTHGIAAAHLSGATHPNTDDLDRAIMETLDDHRVDVVALAGYMKRLGPLVLSQYKGRMLNTHPALLPKFGGQGMFGDRVHKAVLAAGEEVSGATVHLVEGDYDTGPVLSQVDVPVLEGDTPESLRDRVQAAERRHYVTVLERIAMGEIPLEGLRS
jgi:phosphoribosylglycinamide formyltransferase-1